jgi:hypothetical protein
MGGLYFEEFVEGRVFEHALTRTVTEMDNVLFTTLTMNPQPLHLDAEFAKTTEFGRPLVNSIFTLGLVIGISVGDTTLGTEPVYVSRARNIPVYSFDGFLATAQFRQIAFDFERGEFSWLTKDKRLNRVRVASKSSIAPPRVAAF